MIFDALNESADRGELFLRDGVLCHWHLRRDGQLTIREIIVLPDVRREGKGRAVLDYLKARQGANSIYAKCPANLPANEWYKAMGFSEEKPQITRGGKTLRCWRLNLD